MSATILVVDDEESIRNLMRMTLELDGYEVSTAADGPTALDIFEKENPEVVLLDVRLPGMSGIEILDRIKAINQDAEVIIITGHGDMDMAVILAANDMESLNRKIDEIRAAPEINGTKTNIILKKWR